MLETLKAARPKERETLPGPVPRRKGRRQTMNEILDESPDQSAAAFYIALWREVVPHTVSDEGAWLHQNDERLAVERKTWRGAPIFHDGANGLFYLSHFPVTPCHWRLCFAESLGERATFATYGYGPGYADPRPTDHARFISWLEWLAAHPKRREHRERWSPIFSSSRETTTV